MEEGDSEYSKYNEAMFQIQRLHDSWTRCNNYARSGNLIGWKWELDIIWRELCPDVTKLSESKETIKENKDHRLKIAKSTKSKVELYETLNTRHEFLKKLQDSVGKGGVYEDAYADDFD